MRAVPSGFDAYGGADSSPYAGHKVTVDVRQRFTFGAGPSAIKAADFFLFQQGTAAGNLYSSIADCGLCDSRLLDLTTFTTSPTLWSEDAEVVGQQGLAPSRSSLKVDGRNAIAPGSDVRFGDGTHARSLPGLDPIAYSYSRGPGPVTIHETDHFDRCATASVPSWPPPTMSSCPSFRHSGVRVDRVVTQASAATHMAIIDSWRSEDGMAHNLDLQYDEFARPRAGQKPGFAFQWRSPTYSTYASGEIIPAPASAPASWFVSADSTAPDGSALIPQGALTFDPVPDAIVFRGSVDPLLRYHRTIPAGGALVITQVFDMATTRAAVQASAVTARNRLA